MKFEVCDLKETRELAKKILSLLDGKNVILLEGELGAGKTTFAQGILQELEAEGPFTSPTFVVMKDYKLNGKKSFDKAFHFDCYRIGAQDLKEIGWDETIANKNNLVIVEWPERIQEALPQGYVHVKIEVVNETERIFSIKNN